MQKTHSFLVENAGKGTRKIKENDFGSLQNLVERLGSSSKNHQREIIIHTYHMT